MRKEAKEKQEKQPEKQVSKGRGKEMFERKCGWDKKWNNGSVSFGFKVSTKRRLADKFEMSLFYS